MIKMLELLEFTNEMRDEGVMILKTLMSFKTKAEQKLNNNVTKIT